MARCQLYGVQYLVVANGMLTPTSWTPAESDEMLHRQHGSHLLHSILLSGLCSCAIVLLIASAIVKVRGPPAYAGPRTLPQNRSLGGTLRCKMQLPNCHRVNRVRLPGHLGYRFTRLEQRHVGPYVLQWAFLDWSGSLDGVAGAGCHSESGITW